MALSQSEIYSLAKSVGLSDSRAKVAAAIAMPESGGDPNAHNTNAATGDNSYGIWQINMIGDMGPDRRKKLGLTSNDELFNPQTNARAMKLISQDGGNFSPWSTYLAGKHLKYLNTPVTDVAGSDPGWLSKLGGTIASPITAPMDAARTAASAVEMMGKAAAWVSNSENWVRVGYVAAGSVLGIAGLVMVVQSTRAGGAVTKLAKTAASVTPAGKVTRKRKVSP